MLPTALAFMLEHAVGSISAIPIIGVIFSADLRVAVRGWPLLRSKGSPKWLTFTRFLCVPVGLIGKAPEAWSIEWQRLHQLSWLIAAPVKHCA